MNIEIVFENELCNYYITHGPHVLKSGLGPENLSGPLFSPISFNHIVFLIGIDKPNYIYQGEQN